MTTALRRSLGAVAGAALVFSGTAFAADAEPTPHGQEMYAATHWLAGQLATAADVSAFDKANPTVAGALVENTLPGDAGATDWHVTIDALLAFQATGTEKEAVGKIAAALPAHAESFIGPAGKRVAGAIAKELIAAEKPTEFGSVNLIEELGELMVSNPDSGEPTLDGKYGEASTNSDQALAIIGLVKANVVPPAQAINFLRNQQCADGGFRLGGDDKPTCGPDEHSDAATTALAMQALHDAFKLEEVEKPATYLMTTQDASGGFKDANDLNSAATGLAGQALWIAGKGDVAEKAADWVASMQVTKDATKLSGDLGAIAFNKAALDDGLTNAKDGKIAATARAKWRGWTARAVLALTKTGLGHTAPALVLPSEQTETTTSSPTDTTTTTPTTTTTSSTDTSSSGSPNLADTGFSAPTGLLVGLALLVSGSALVLLARRRTPQ
ncbi:prenyltransferase/squalene oxidase repeat-containing protein [Amycolatopsis sp. NPDC059657]|uniref:prenyltransferase/squalene oxidase repeat-containing protein n=1 Tax=Amycolatopsis sp. NPDC059657 TaxID=3346899 RepID=UPI00366B1DF0